MGKVDDRFLNDKLIPLALRLSEDPVPKRSRLARCAALDFADKSLAGREWLVGDACSIADIGCWGRMVFAHEGGLSIDARPNLAAWRDRLKAMPGFALPYDLIPKKDAEFEATSSS